MHVIVIQNLAVFSKTIYKIIIHDKGAIYFYQWITILLSNKKRKFIQTEKNLLIYSVPNKLSFENSLIFFVSKIIFIKRTRENPNN